MTGAAADCPSRTDSCAFALFSFDPAAHQKERVAHLEGMKKMGKASDGTNMADVELHNEQTLRDAKQQGLQGNMMIDDSGKFKIMTEDDCGGQTEK